MQLPLCVDTSHLFSHAEAGFKIACSIGLRPSGAVLHSFDEPTVLSEWLLPWRQHRKCCVSYVSSG